MTEHSGVRVGFFAVLLAVFAYLSWLIVAPFLQYLLAALLLAFLFRPAQRRLEPRLGARISASLLVTVAVTGTVAVLTLLVVSLPADVTDVSEALADAPAQAEIEQRIEDLFGVEVDIGSLLESAPERFADLLVGDITGIVGAVTDFFLGIVLFLFVLYYLIQEGDDLVAWVEEMLPMDDETTEELVGEAYETTWAVLKSHVFIAVLQGFVAGIGLWIVGIPNVVFWSLVMMIAELFPVVGVAAVLGPAVAYLAATGQFLEAVFLAVYGLTAVAVVDDYVRALAVDRGSSLHSAAILVGVFGGVYAFGVMGLFFGPIVVGLFQTLVRLFNENYDVTAGGAADAGGGSDSPTDAGDGGDSGAVPGSDRRESPTAPEDRPDSPAREGS